MEHEGDNDIDRSWHRLNGPEASGKETEWTGDQRKNWIYLDHSTVKIN